MPVRAWKATAPDFTGHRPQIAGNCGADRSDRPTPLPAKPEPAYRHAAAARPPRGCAVGAARLRAGTAARLRVAAPYCELPGATRPVTGDTAPHGQRPAELHNPRITQSRSGKGCRRLKALAPRRGGAAACGRASPAQGVACQAERGGRRPEALAAAARRGETRSGSMRSTAERPRRGNARR